MHDRADDLLFTEDRDWASLSARYPWYATARLGRLLQQPGDPEAAHMAALVMDHPVLAAWWLARQTEAKAVQEKQSLPREAPAAIAASEAAPEAAVHTATETMVAQPADYEAAEPTPEADPSETVEVKAAAEAPPAETMPDQAAGALVAQPTPDAGPIESVEVDADEEEPPVETPAINQPEVPEPVMDSGPENPAAEEKTFSDDSTTEEQPIKSTDTQTPPPEDQQLADRLGSALQQALEAMHAPVAAQLPDLPAFQPQHTIDYFEAVGIRFRDVAQKDKLYGQVKTFTQWLKAMKQIDYKTGEVAEDKTVSSNAAASLKPQEIFTETMAEVLLRQGRKAEAAAIFTHLQALHPDKSAYFAARLNDLKST